MSWRPLDKVYNEDVALYTKKGDGYELLANVDQKYYEDILSRYVKMGTTDSIAGRKKIEDRLEKAGGNINDNLNTFQSYTYAARIELNDEKFKSAQDNLVNLCNNSALFKLDEFINNSFPNTQVYNKYFDKAWCSLPEAPTHGAPGCGELFLAFLCDGIKPKKGDLSTGGLEIELKGPGGRLCKTAALTDDFSDLEKPGGDNDLILQNISKFIAKYCGLEQSKDGLFKLLKDHNLAQLMFQERDYFLQRGRLRPGMGKLGVNMINQLGGIIQLYEYQKAQGFDVFLAYNQIGNDLVLQTVNMQNLGTLSDFYGQINNLKGILRFNRRKDGKGWSCNLAGIK